MDKQLEPSGISLGQLKTDRPQEAATAAVDDPDELVVYHSEAIEHELTFDNRWKTGDLVDYDKVERWNDNRLQMNCSELIRIKICTLNRQQIAGLLSRLSNRAIRLKILEIDILELLVASQTEYTFDALYLLSIDEVRVVDASGLPYVATAMAPPQPTIKFNARQLSTVGLGSDSINYVTFSNIRTIRALIIECDLNGKLFNFKSLEILVVYEVYNVQVDDLMSFASGHIGHLRHLECYVNKPTSTSDTLSLEELTSLRNIYQNIKFCRTSASNEIAVFFNGVPVNFDYPFEFYKFHESLMICHWYNYTANELPVGPLPSVHTFDFIDLSNVSVGGEFGEMYYDRATNRIISHTLQFAQLYPNIQSIDLDEQAGHQTSENEFYDLVRNSRALRELEISNAGFSASFYARLAKLESLRTLTDFYLIESKPVLVNFDFLRHWQWMVRFCSNLVRKPAMLQLIEQMRPAARYLFMFLSETQDVNYDVSVEKDKDAAHLKVILTNDEEGCLTEKTIECSQADAFFNSGEYGPFGHWLDEPYRQAQFKAMAI